MNVWIGLNKNDVLPWGNNLTLAYLAFAICLRDDHCPCMSLNYKQWYDFRCDFMFPYICKMNVSNWKSQQIKTDLPKMIPTTYPTVSTIRTSLHPNVTGQRTDTTENLTTTIQPAINATKDSTTTEPSANATEDSTTTSQPAINDTTDDTTDATLTDVIESGTTTVDPSTETTGNVPTSIKPATYTKPSTTTTSIPTTATAAAAATSKS